MGLVRADGLWAKKGRRLVEGPGEQGYLHDVGGLRLRRQVPHLHILCHALPKDRRHGGLRCHMEHAASSHSILTLPEPITHGGMRGRSMPPPTTTTTSGHTPLARQRISPSVVLPLHPALNRSFTL